MDKALEKNVFSPFDYTVIVFLFLFAILVLILSGDEYLAVVLIPFAFVSIGLFFPKFSAILVLCSIFLPIMFSRFFISIPASLLIPISFLITTRQIKYADFKDKNIIGIIIYLIAITPSLINSVKISTSLLLMLNFYTTIYIMYIFKMLFESWDEIYEIIKVFLLLVLSNSIYVIVNGIITGDRNFGFVGIMFVDYVGIATLISFIALFTLKGPSRYLNLVLTILFSTALLITQTRTSWITTILSIVFFTIYFLKHSQKLKVNRIFLSSAIIIFLSVASIMFFYIRSTSATFEDRVTQVNKLDSAFDEEGKAQNSLITRLMIWHTAYNAFSVHPYIGIGVNAFPFSSYAYYTIPKFLYEDYVEGLTPHQTFIAVLVETGLLGLTGFLIMILFFIRQILYLLKNIERENQLVILTIAGINIYIFISMLATDCWLWGHGAVLWGFALGFSSAAIKMINEKKHANF